MDLYYTPDGKLMNDSVNGRCYFIDGEMQYPNITTRDLRQIQFDIDNDMADDEAISQLLILILDAIRIHTIKIEEALALLLVPLV